jgi:hypothetical protein
MFRFGYHCRKRPSMLHSHKLLFCEIEVVVMEVTMKIPEGLINLWLYKENKLKD